MLTLRPLLFPLRPLLFFCSAALLSAAQVVLTNGDVITGSIVRMEDGKLTLKSELIGEVTMPWSAVRSLKSEEPVTVVLPGGQQVTGEVASSGNTLEVATPTATRAAPLTGIPAIRGPAAQRSWERLQHPGILQLWTGTIDLGLALARGNARTDTLTTGFHASRITREDRTDAFFQQIYSTARIDGVTSTVASALHGGWSFNRDITPKLFFTALNQYDHDSFQDLDLRFVAGIGAGWTAVKNETTMFALSSGADYSRESFIRGLNRNSAEANFGDTVLFRLSGLTSVTQSFRFFANLSRTGDYRFTFDMSAVTSLRKWLGYHVTATDLFLSNPVFGRQRNDLLLSTGLRVSFGK